MEKITCHGDTSANGVFRFGQPHWLGPEADVRADGYVGQNFRTCSYCGSIHPDDLLTFLKQGAQMHGADWKYGWPHKFYVKNIPHPMEGKEVKQGSESWGEQGPDGIWIRHEEPIMGIAGKMWAKWYNEHLIDLDVEAFGRVADALLAHCGIEWFKDEKGIGYRSPRPGYQK
jgi:hypothetical protein